MKFDQEKVAHQFERDLLLLPAETKILHPVIVSKVISPKRLPVESLDKILNEEAVTDKPHRVRIAVMHTLPVITDKVDSVLSLLRVFNTKTSSYREYNPKAPALKKDEVLSLGVQLYVQDYSVQLSNQVVRVILRGEEALFNAFKAEEVLKKKDVQERVWQTLTNMLKFNIFIEAVVAFNKDGVLEIKDTELKQY